MRVFRIAGIVMLVLALVAAAALVWNLRPGRHDGWIETTGTVVSLDRHVSRDRDGDRSVTYAMWVEYADEHGNTFTAVSSVRSSQPKPIGATVDVRYPPGRPGEAELDNEGTWFAVLFFGIWAGVLGLLGTVFTIVGFRTRDLWEPLRTAEPAELRSALHREDTNEPTGPPGPGPSDPGDEPGDWPRLPQPDDR